MTPTAPQVHTCWQRRVTRSRHVRVGSLRGLWTATQARARGRDPILPSLLSAPPPTLFPLLPTFGGRPRRPTDTHDPARAGSPRLVHDDDDEFVAIALGGVVRIHGAPGEEGLLRTGARLELGDHCLVFNREEYADHGRPYGGRVGGEIGHQRPLPVRVPTPRT